jgi:1,4-alpha-glucan branching enzyme
VKANHNLLKKVEWLSENVFLQTQTTMIPVTFTYLTGLKRQIFHHPRLRGSWDLHGRQADSWSEVSMTEIIAEDGCPAFTVTMQFNESEVGNQFRWGVILDAPTAINTWGITTETSELNEQHRYHQFKLQPVGTNQEERFYFTYSR